MRTLLAAILVLGLGACGGKADDALNKMEGFKNQVCACADKACAEQVMRDMEKSMEEWAKNNASVKPTKEEDQKADKLGDEMQECMKKFDKK